MFRKLTNKKNTYSVHRCVKREKSLFHELIQGLVILSTDLRHHVTGDESRPAPDRPTIKAIIILIPVYLKQTKEKNASTIGLKCKANYITSAEPHLDDLSLFKRQFLIRRIGVRGHG